MTVAVADIDRWDAGDVREVFRASRNRAEASFNASNGIAQLPAFDTWGGDASEAAKEAMGKTRKDLDAHGDEALAVARAADRAADDIDVLKTKLADLRERARQLRMELNPMSSTFLPAAGSNLDEVDVALAEAELNPQLSALLAEAERIDDELASAINMATGKTPVPEDAGPRVGPQGLTPTQVESDANEARLDRERAAAQRQAGQLQQQIDQLAAQSYVSGNASQDTLARINDLKSQLDATKHHLGELDAVHDALGKGKETYLTMFDPRDGTGKPVLAAIAVGNPDTARKVSVSVPGVGSRTEQTLPSMVAEASTLRAETQRQLHNAGLPDSVATIAWMGYDPPPNPIDTLSPADLQATLTDGQAIPGAQSLSSYLEHVRENNPGGHLALFGHSYGSLTASLALQDLNAHGLHPVNDVVFYGSPGLELNNPSDLGVPDGHALAMRGHSDLIAGPIAEFSSAHGWGMNPYGGMLPQLSAEAGMDHTGITREGVVAHSDYPRLGSDGQLRMSGYNLAAVLAGLPNNEVLLPPPVAQPLPIIPPGGQVPLPQVPGR